MSGLDHKSFAALGFGEVMMRLSSEEGVRIAKSHHFTKHAGAAS